MKKIIFLSTILLVSTLSISTSSCSKKGCTERDAVNFDSKAEKNDDSCIFPAEKLVGQWNVSETESNNTVDYSVTITKKSASVITVSATRVNPPVYFMNNLDITIDWDAQTLETPGTTIDGTIKNENDFEINYLFGAGSSVYSVVQHYTR